MEQSPGYPPRPSFRWYFDGLHINISSGNPNVSVYPQIVFNPVLRNQSGNYSMIASTEGGDSTGYFILNVHCKLIGTYNDRMMKHVIRVLTKHNAVSVVVHIIILRCRRIVNMR